MIFFYIYIFLYKTIQYTIMPFEIFTKGID